MVDHWGIHFCSGHCKSSEAPDLTEKTAVGKHAASVCLEGF